MPASASPAPTAPTTYISLQEGAARGYAAESTLRAWIRDGRLPAVKFGGRVKVTVEDLDALAIPKTSQKAARSGGEVDAAVARVVAAAPRLTNEQRERLAIILGGGS